MTTMTRADQGALVGAELITAKIYNEPPVGWKDLSDTLDEADALLELVVRANGKTKLQLCFTAIHAYLDRRKGEGQCA